MKKTLFVLLLTACGPKPGASVHNHASPPKADRNAHATNLADAMRARGLTPITLDEIRRDMTHSLGEAPKQQGQELVVIEEAGWNAEPSVFARRASDGVIVLISQRPNKIVDRHEDAGCMTFAGGRGWFEQVTYRMPEGEKFGGTVKVEWDEHIVVKDYSDRQPDGSPCPPPAID
jgi:hypothetical protein